MKAGVNRSSLCLVRASTIEVIMPAAWYAMFLDGYAISSGKPLDRFTSGDEPAGGM